MWFFICVLFILFSNLKCKKGYRKSEKKQLQVEKKRLQRQAIEIIYTKLAFIWAFGCSRPGTHSVFEGEEETLKYTLWNTRLVKFSELQSRSQVIRKARIEKKVHSFFFGRSTHGHTPPFAGTKNREERNNRPNRIYNASTPKPQRAMRNDQVVVSLIHTAHKHKFIYKWKKKKRPGSGVSYQNTKVRKSKDYHILN